MKRRSVRLIGEVLLMAGVMEIIAEASVTLQHATIFAGTVLCVFGAWWENKEG